MSVGRREKERQEDLWIAGTAVARSPGHPFYAQLNRVFAEAGFDRWVEQRCEKFYAKRGRPSVPPGVYFRMLMIGYFEGIDSERGIAWRCADSLTLRDFLGYKLTETTPDHSTLSVIRNRVDVETHTEVFAWVLARLDEHGLIRGKTIGVDATTLEANAALSSLVRRDTGQGYQEFLEDLAKESGIETPTRADLAKVDRKRKGKGSNKDWTNPNDPDAKITRMKDGRTHLAHKAEHAVDMDTGATVAVTLQPADRGDTHSVGATLEEATKQLDDVGVEPEEVVADKGYHSKRVLTVLQAGGFRTYIAEPVRGRQRWEDQQDEQHAVYSNRRRARGDRGKRLQRSRGELLERPFAHCYETGGMRRTHLRGHENILKRLMVHVAASNLSLLMRTRFGVGKPKVLVDLKGQVLTALYGFWRALRHASLVLSSPQRIVPPRLLVLDAVWAKAW